MSAGIKYKSRFMFGFGRRRGDKLRTKEKSSPEKTLKITALPVQGCVGLYSFVSSTPVEDVTPTIVVGVSFVLLIISYLLVPKFAVLMVFSCIAQYLLLLSEENDESRRAGGVGILVIICISIMISRGVLPFS